MAFLDRLLKKGIGFLALLFIFFPSLTLAECNPCANPNLSNQCNCSTSIAQSECQNRCDQQAQSARQRALSIQYGGTKFTTTVEKPFQNSSLQAFPNGKDCAEVTMEAIKRDGTFLTNEPLVFEKPDGVTINGPQNTNGGSVKWCVTSTKAINARIVVKLQNFPQRQSTFRVNFRPNFRITDKTDRNSFFFNLPITFIAQIDPVTAHGLQEAKLTYTYNRTIKKLFAFKTERREVTIPLQCSPDGICTATIDDDNTAVIRVLRRTFSYTFTFKDQNGNVFTKTSRGTLRIP